MKSKALVLLSGGMDSSINLELAHAIYDVRLAVTFDYGQRSKKQEIKASAALAKHYHLEHLIISLPFFSSFQSSSLLNSDKSIPVKSEISMDDHRISSLSAERVWVPNRNGIFVNIAAGIAEEKNIKHIIVGFNSEEAATFPDNSLDFLNAANQALKFSTKNHVEVTCLTVNMNKSEMANAVKKTNFPWSLIWSCYFDGDKPCGECESCQRQARALKSLEK